MGSWHWPPAVCPAGGPLTSGPRSVCVGPPQHGGRPAPAALLPAFFTSFLPPAASCMGSGVSTPTDQSRLFTPVSSAPAAAQLNLGAGVGSPGAGLVAHTLDLGRRGRAPTQPPMNGEGETLSALLTCVHRTSAHFVPSPSPAGPSTHAPVGTHGHMPACVLIPSPEKG